MMRQRYSPFDAGCPAFRPICRGTERATAERNIDVVRNADAARDHYQDWYKAEMTRMSASDPRTLARGASLQTELSALSDSDMAEFLEIKGPMKDTVEREILSARYAFEQIKTAKLKAGAY